MDKKSRQKLLIEIITQNDISTQNDLTNALVKAGVFATQATISRDIKELGILKLEENGKRFFRYMKKDNLESNYIKVLKAGFVSMDSAMNILIIKTVSGMAMAVATAIDSMKMSEIVGSIAGDDTIMCAIRTVEDTKVIMNKLNKILE